MDKNITNYFADVIGLAGSFFTEIVPDIDTTPQRDILKLQARYGHYRILVTELFTDEVRKYRYYVLRNEWVEAGFDNSPDAQAIRLKYGRRSKRHVGEYVPHLHLENKTQLLLTEEMTFPHFIIWLEENLPLH